MEVIPAIDLRGGKCVRLYQGDYSRETVFSEEPAAVARHWESLGARRLHLVDLDGAREGELRNAEALSLILKAVAVPCQAGGGVRRLETVAELFALGLERVVLGTAAVQNPELVREACRRYPGRVLASLDARGGQVAIAGWREASPLTPVQLIARLASLGVRRFIYTDIERDGTLAGPNLSAIAGLKQASPYPLLVAGGISSLEHLAALKALGVEGAIVGLALYSGKMNLREGQELVI